MAMNVPEGEDESVPSTGDYVLHFFTFYWKVLLAIIPPTK